MNYVKGSAWTGAGITVSGLKIHTTRWMAMNYIGLLVWIFIWMFDQARVRGKNVLLWLLPFALAPLPTLMPFILFLQKGEVGGSNSITCRCPC